MNDSIRIEEWEWFGRPAHFIGVRYCQFRMATRVGIVMVSTVGDYRVPIMNETATELGYKRLFETMVFPLEEPVKLCEERDCGCRRPKLNFSELEMLPANTAGEAQANHLKACRDWSQGSRQMEARHTLAQRKLENADG